jgi:catechol 2,3-dioxygenase-like lactoylglutathione lyase family enzyme
MSYRLDHVAINCKDISESIRFYERFLGGKATPIRKGAVGYGFCFVNIDGAPAIQLMESSGDTGIHHYGFVTDDIEKVATEFRAKGAEVLRENRDAAGKLTTIFVRDCNGLQMEVRIPR